MAKTTNIPDVKGKVAATFRHLQRDGWLFVHPNDASEVDAWPQVVDTTIAQEFMFELMEGGEWHICHHPPKDE